MLQFTQHNLLNTAKCNIYNKAFLAKRAFFPKGAKWVRWNLAYVCVGPVFKWDSNLGPPGWKASTNPLDHRSCTMYLTAWQPGLSERHLCLTEWENACLSGMANDCPVRLVACSSSFDSFYDQYYWLVYNCQSNQFSLIIVFIIGQLEP